MYRNIKLLKSLYVYRWLLDLLLLAIMDICIFVVKREMFYISLSLSVAALCLMLFIYWKEARRLDKKLGEFGFEFNQVQRRMLLDLRVPYAMLDQQGFILWANDEFVRITGMYPKHQNRIEHFCPTITSEVLQSCQEGNPQDQFSLIGDRKFRVSLKNVPLEEQEEGGKAGKGELIAVYLYDETKILELSLEREQRRMAVGLIYVDNYEEALSGINDVNGSLIPALVERKITKYLRDNDGVVQKIEKDKFLIMFQHKYLEAMKEDHFQIVDDVRSLHIGNTLNITISVGIGICSQEDYSFRKAFEGAKEAVGRASERGGDQVVLWGDRESKKDMEGFTYLGGKTESVEKRSKVRSRVMTEAICEQIRNADNVLIMGHEKGDADSFGACIGMYRIARVLTDDVHIVLNEILKTVAMLHEQYVNSPSFEGGMFISSAEAIRKVNRGTLVIVVDVNEKERVECKEILSEAGNIVVIDHHREKNPINTKLAYSETYASSTCEMVTEMIQFVEKRDKWLQADRHITLSPYDADAIYAGILLDTNSFVTKTGVRTFEAATYLKRRGADMGRVRRCFRKDKTSVYEKARIINTADVFLDIFAFAINDCKAEEESPTEIGAQIANDLLDISGVKGSFVFTEYQGKVWVSARAMEGVNVGMIMQRCGGGGHFGMAGVQFTDCSVWEAVRRVKDIIRSMKEKNEL